MLPDETAQKVQRSLRPHLHIQVRVTAVVDVARDASNLTTIHIVFGDLVPARTAPAFSSLAPQSNPWQSPESCCAPLITQHMLCISDRMVVCVARDPVCKAHRAITQHTTGKPHCSGKRFRQSHPWSFVLHQSASVLGGCLHYQHQACL